MDWKARLKRGRILFLILPLFFAMVSGLYADEAANETDDDYWQDTYGEENLDALDYEDMAGAEDISMIDDIQEDEQTE